MRTIFRCLKIFLFVSAFFAGTSKAAVRPEASKTDPHFQTVQYNPEQVVQLFVGKGYELSVAFEEGEQIDNIAIGDAALWQVTPNKRGDYIFIKLVGQSYTSTNLTIITSTRAYLFILTPSFGSENELPFLVKFLYPKASQDQKEASELSKIVAPAKKYKLSGSNALKPVLIYDDGLRTYIKFSSNQDMPAIFSIDDHGIESLVDGKMRDGYFVIDTIFQRLLFRLGGQTATAKRVVPKGSEPP